MNLEELETSGDVKRELASKKESLQQLQSEQDDVIWLSQEPDRNALEREIRKLEGLFERMVTREKEQATKELRDRYDRAYAVYSAVDPDEEAFIESIVLAARAGRKGLLARHAHAGKQYEAMRTLLRLGQKLNESPPAPIMGDPRRVVAKIRERIGQDMVGEPPVATRLFDMFTEMFMPSPPNRTEHAKWLLMVNHPEGAPEARAAERPSEAPPRVITVEHGSDGDPVFLGRNGTPIEEFDPSKEARGAA